jgi:hypothetical protein
LRPPLLPPPPPPAEVIVVNPVPEIDEYYHLFQDLNHQKM